MKADLVGAEMSNFALHRRAEQVPLGAATEDGIPVAVMVNVEVNSRLTQNPRADKILFKELTLDL